MRLQQAARHGDKMLCLDAYSSQPAFFAQLSLYDDTKRDSETQERRILSTGPESVVPARRVVAAGGQRFIVGHGNIDTFRGRVIRVGYVSHEATELSRVRTLAQACLNQPGFTAWAGAAWVKNLADNEQSSSLTPQHHIHFGANEQVRAQHLVTFRGRLLLVRTAHEGPAGTLIALGDELPEPSIEQGTVTGSGGYNATLDQYTTINQPLRLLRLRWQSLYEYRSAAAPKFSANDLQFVIAKASFTALPGMRLSLSDGDWFVESSTDGGDVWLCRAVRHA